MRTKAQASLEMVVGLIILLVVAGVVISLVLHFVNQKNMPNAESIMKLTDFESKCGEYCKDYNSVDYCKYYADVVLDKNADSTELVTTGLSYWQTCEKRVYCFLQVPCKDRFGSGGLDTLTKCKKTLCQFYKNKYGDDIDSINAAVSNDINFEGCAIGTLQDSENWYIKGGFDTSC